MSLPLVPNSYNFFFHCLDSPNKDSAFLFQGFLYFEAGMEMVKKGSSIAGCFLRKLAAHSLASSAFRSGTWHPLLVLVWRLPEYRVIRRLWDSAVGAGAVEVRHVQHIGGGFF